MQTPMENEGYNDAEHVEEIVVNTGKKKSTFTADKTIYLGLLAGFFVGLASILSITVAGGTHTCINVI